MKMPERIEPAMLAPCDGFISIHDKECSECQYKTE